jgi:hypothetical protein
MIDNDAGRSLHDTATRGGVLSDEERTQLDHWYASHDRDEGAALDSPSPSPHRADLQSQVDSAVADLATVTQRIQSLAAENDMVRREIATLRQQLAERSRTQPA